MGITPPVVVLVAIVAAAAVTAVFAAVHRVYTNRTRPTDPEASSGMIYSFSNEQSLYMRDVRMRNQLSAWGVAPAFEDSYRPPRSQVARPGSRGVDTSMSYG